MPLCVPRVCPRYGLGSPRAGVGRLPWNKAPPSRPYTRPWSSEGTPPPPTPAVDEDKATPPERPAHAPLVSLARKGLLDPGVGQWVQMRRDVYSVVLGVSQACQPAHAPGPPCVVVQVADFDGFRAPPFLGRTTLQRDELMWDPRGWWCHTLVLQEAARQLPPPTVGRACIGHPAQRQAQTEPRGADRTASTKGSMRTRQGSKVSSGGSTGSGRAEAQGSLHDTLGTRDRKSVV